MKRFFLILILISSLILPIYSIGFGYHVFKVRTAPEFSMNGWRFPTSVVYQFNFPVPDFIPESSTSFAFRLDNGLDYRTLRQNPETGNILSKEDKDYPVRDYMSLFDEFSLIFSQGFAHWSVTDTDILTLYISAGGRFENAYESTSYFSDPEHRDGVFHKVEGDKIVNREPFGSGFLKGTPELSGSRSVFDISVEAGLDVNLMYDDVTTKNGIKLSSSLRYSPKEINFFTDTSDYLLFESHADLAWTLFTLPFVDDLSSLSMMLTNSTTYRYLEGECIPYYVQGGDIWEAKALPREHVITSSFALTLFGPQFFAEDVYPYVSAFFDLAYGWGGVLNSDEIRVGDFSASYGIRAQMVLFNVARVYYDLGVVASDGNLGEVDIVQRFGFAVGI